MAATGISVELIALRACEFHDHVFESLVSDKVEAHNEQEQDGHVDLKASIRVFFNGANRSALVELTIEAKPDAQPSWSALVSVVGHFTEHENAALPIESFAWSNGIAYLVPFVRERLASLTSSSAFDTYYLPPLGVATLLKMAGFPPRPAVAATSSSEPTAGVVSTEKKRARSRSAPKQAAKRTK